MAGHAAAPKPDHSPDGLPDPDLLDHVRALGLGSVEEYVAWCARHGFSRRTTKHWRLRLKERAFATRAAADARLAQKKRELRRPKHTIQAIFRGDITEGQLTEPYLKAVCRAFQSAKGHPRTCRAFLDLLTHAGRCADLLAAQPVVPQYGRQDGNTFVGGLLALAHHAADWLRPVGEWRPQTHNARRQFASLARHLFARWPVPAFMDSVWFKGISAPAARQQQWFLHLGRGENLRTADLPLPYTKRMAHHFMQAPADYTAEAALRWGQVHALGGDARLVRAVAATRLGTDFEHDDFWTSVFRFLIANPALGVLHVGPVVDYLHGQKFAPQEVVSDSGVVERKPPPQPDLTMKGRTPAALLRQVEAWHAELAWRRLPRYAWPPSGIAPFEWTERDERGADFRVWTIRELLNTEALVAEGQAMRHCVATYARSCAQGACSIWALEVVGPKGQSKLLTVEVRSATRVVCQARRKGNGLPTDEQRGILRRWAAQAGLRVGEDV
jgi:hypothetical protein